MKNKKDSSTWDFFCDYISKYAIKHNDFILLTTEKLSSSVLLKSLPPEKIFTPTAGDFNLVANAAGLAMSGKHPWVISDSVSTFVSSYKQIRDSLAFPSLSVSLVVSEGGLSEGQNGVSYNILQDIALMRSLPNMNVYVPSDENTLIDVVKASSVSTRPSYIRLNSTRLPLFENKPFELSNPSGARIIKSGTDVTIYTYGTMVTQALLAVDNLEKQGISAEIIDCYCIKPFLEQQLLSSVRKTGCCVVAEEHNSIGGLCGAVSECLCRTYPVPVRFVAVEDQFVNSGHTDELREYYGLTCREIVTAAAEVWALRRR